MKDIRGMRIDKDRDDNCINYTPYISTEYSLHQLLTLIVSSRHIFLVTGIREIIPKVVIEVILKNGTIL